MEGKEKKKDSKCTTRSASHSDKTAEVRLVESERDLTHLVLPGDSE